jgi:hypothetical protein
MERSALLTDIPLLIHVLGRHFQIERSLDAHLPFRLKREDRLRFAAPMNLRFDPRQCTLSRAGDFLSAVVVLALGVASH